MFTTGSKLFLGATLLSTVATIVYGNSTAGSAGWTGTIGLASLAAVFAFLAAVNYFVHDSNVPSMQQDAAVNSAAAQPPAGRSMWPMIAAAGVAMLVVGAATTPFVFRIGLVALMAALVEWMVQGWSERASDDPLYNATVRKRILHPLEFPLLAAIGLGVVIYSFSRIMLFLSKSNGPLVFIVVGVLILSAGFIFATKPSLKKGLIAAVCAVGALGLVSAGAVTAIDGQRKISEHPSTRLTAEVCELTPAQAAAAGAELAEIDQRGSQAVANKSNTAATIVLEGGQLHAYQLGSSKPSSEVSLVRSNASNVVFRNLDAATVRFTVHMGRFKEKINGTDTFVEPRECTTAVRQGGQQLLTLKFAKPTFATPDSPYTVTIPGLDGLKIDVVVP